MNLNQVTLPAVDIEEAVAFYTRMGFTLIVHSPHYARFECPSGDATFSVHLIDQPSAPNEVVVYFECDDLDVQVQGLVGLGFQFDKLPTDERWLWREARLTDPTGNVICLYHAGENRKNPPWRVQAGAGATG